MKPRVLALSVAMGTVVVGAVILLLRAGVDSESPAATEPVAAEASVATVTPTEPTSEPPATAPSSTLENTTTTTTLATSSTTTPTPQSTTTSSTTTSTVPPSDYTAVPKPGGGPNAVAPGGALTKHLAADIAAAFGFDVTEVQAAIDSVALPAEADGDPEGWLAPGNYQIADEATATDVVQAMVDRRVAQLERRGIGRDRWYRVLTAASVIEKETYNQNEKPNVARVLTNRLAGGGPLQMDSIILYPVPEDRIFTTAEERSSDQPYNSYRHNGLPPTPICSPDEASIDAFLAPPPGDWWFYVTIDLHTGETRYAITYEKHKANVELLRAWLRENPTD